MQDQTVLLTGATGFVGSQCLEALLSDTRVGYVHAISSRPQGNTDRVTWHCCDLLDQQQVNAVVGQIGADALLHLAWCPAVPGKFWSDPANNDWTSTTLNLLAVFATAGGSRAVCVGTCAEYDWWSEGAEDLKESHPLRPQTIYGASKCAAYWMSQTKYSDILSLAWARLFNLYGPNEYQGRLVESVISSLNRGEVAKCSSGEQVRDFMHSRDAADALIALLLSDVTGAVNVASGAPITIAEFVTTIGAIAGRPELISLGALPTRSSEPPRIVADVGRLRNQVGFEPSVSLRARLKEHVTGTLQIHQQ